MLEKEFAYYLNNQADLVKKYNGKFLVIKGETVMGHFDTQGEAYIDATKKFEVGTFLIQRCSLGDQDYTQTFHSRVSFAHI
jgi:hypothetical protein